MEQFLRLNWSWHKYEEEKNIAPRVFNFETINEHDVLSRTLNEIHKCVLPNDDKYRLFKTPEEIASSSAQLGDVASVDISDPRKNPTRLMRASHEYIKDYGYSSELISSEQQTLLNSIKLKITHNPKLLKQKAQQKNHNRYPPTETTPEILQKHKTEAVHFNKCAEIFFCRHISELNNLVDDKMKSFLINRWYKLEYIEDEYKFQVITMLLRDQVCEGEVQVALVQTNSDDFNREAYLISEMQFPSLKRFTADNLKFYCNLKSIRRKEMDPNPEYDVILSVDLLAKLFVDSEQFSVRFENQEKTDGKLFTTCHDPVPTKPVGIPEALREIVETSLYMSFDWSSMDCTIKTSSNESKVYRAEHIDDVMKKIYLRYKKGAGDNDFNRLWKFSKGAQSFIIAVNQTDAYFARCDDGTVVPATISIKLEYQAKFGAEKMTREELLREWCMQKFSATLLTFRYRVDAMTSTILSITQVTLEEIETDLLEHYNTNPLVLMGNLINIFSCLQRLPQSTYMMQTKFEDVCKKLYIYKESESGKSLTDDAWEVSSAFSRKWITIDELTPTFLHVNHHFAPCCFPAGIRKHSYIPKPPIKKKKVPAKAAQIQKKAQEQKAPESKPGKTAAQKLRKRKKRKINKKLAKA